MTISLEDGRRIERRDEGSVIVDLSAGCLFEVERYNWLCDEPLVFDTPGGALAAFILARKHEDGRKRQPGGSGPPRTSPASTVALREGIPSESERNRTFPRMADTGDFKSSASAMGVALG